MEMTDIHPYTHIAEQHFLSRRRPPTYPRLQQSQVRSMADAPAAENHETGPRRASVATPPDGHLVQSSDVKPEPDAPLDPVSPDVHLDLDTAAVSNAGYPSYSPYASHELAQYTMPPQAGYAAPHAAWAQPHTYFPPALQYAQMGGMPPSLAPPRPGQQFAFVPLPGAQQHKRPRRKFEEIERMYKCGYDGCEKAYGTLNHLNAHVTMQSHGSKRTPEEFKDIRKEWKQRKKDEDAQRKADEVRTSNGDHIVSRENTSHAINTALQSSIHSATASSHSMNGSNPVSAIDSHASESNNPAYASPTRPQLPPINYAPSAGPAPPPSYSNGVEQMFQNAASGPGGYTLYPTSPFGNSPPLYMDRPGQVMNPSSFTPSILTYGHSDGEVEKSALSTNVHDSDS